MWRAALLGAGFGLLANSAVACQDFYGPDLRELLSADAVLVGRFTDQVVGPGRSDPSSLPDEDISSWIKRLSERDPEALADSFLQEMDEKMRLRDELRRQANARGFNYEGMLYATPLNVEVHEVLLGSTPAAPYMVWVGRYALSEIQSLGSDKEIIVALEDGAIMEGLCGGEYVFDAAGEAGQAIYEILEGDGDATAEAAAFAASLDLDGGSIFGD